MVGLEQFWGEARSVYSVPSCGAARLWGGMLVNPTVRLVLVRGLYIVVDQFIPSKIAFATIDYEL